jgi:hypothetical protein
VNGWLAFATTFVIIFAAIYLLWLYQRVFFGKVGDYDPAVALAHGADHPGASHAVMAPDDPTTNQSGPTAGADNRQHGEHGQHPTPASEKFGDPTARRDTNRVGTDTFPEKGSTHAVPAGHGHRPDPDILANGARFPDLNLPEGLALIPMGILAIVVGVFPALVLDFLTVGGTHLTITMAEHSNTLAALVRLVGR